MQTGPHMRKQARSSNNDLFMTESIHHQEGGRWKPVTSLRHGTSQLSTFVDGMIVYLSNSKISPGVLLNY